jgi:ATP-dependent DNA helicase RecQ
VLALTATATESVARDVAERLRLRAPLVVRTSCERANLSLAVVQTPSPERKREALAAILARERGAGIVYTTTVKCAEELWGELGVRLGEGVGRYHGELPTDVRSATQDAFMDGRYRVMVATKAFGMGVDKPDVRFIVHDAFPESLEAYVQEPGRAGRDGEPAHATLLYRREDRRIHDYFRRHKYARDGEIDRVVAAVAERAARGTCEAEDVARAAGVAERKVTALLYALARRGALAPRGGAGTFAVTDEALLRGASRALATEAEALRVADRARAEAMMEYGERATCRWAQVRAHFGEAATSRCGRCDVCRAGGPGRDEAEPEVESGRCP